MNTHCLETPRITLREFNPVVAKLVFETYNDKELAAFLGVPHDALEIEKNRYAAGLGMFNKSFVYFHLIEKESALVMGWCGFHTWFINHNRAELGYMLYDDKWKNKGYMTEVLPPILTYGFEKMGLHRIEALVGPTNEPSLKLMKNFGFVQEGLLREHYVKNNVAEDSLMFGLLKRDYIK